MRAARRRRRSGLRELPALSIAKNQAAALRRRQRLGLLLDLVGRDEIDRDRLGRHPAERMHLGDRMTQRQRRHMRDRRYRNVRSYVLPNFHRVVRSMRKRIQRGRREVVDGKSGRRLRICRRAAASIPFRRKAEIGQPALRVAERGRSASISSSAKARNRRCRCFPTAARCARCAGSPRRSAAPASAGRPGPGSCDASRPIRINVSSFLILPLATGL